LRFASEVLGRVIEVPAEFVTDLSSVPRTPLAWFLAGGTASAAAVIHDWLYSVGDGSRRDADHVLWEAMRATRVPLWRAWLIYRAVRLGGWAAWRKHRRGETPAA